MPAIVGRRRVLEVVDRLQQRLLGDHTGRRRVRQVVGVDRPRRLTAVQRVAEHTCSM